MSLDRDTVGHSGTIPAIPRRLATPVVLHTSSTINFNKQFLHVVLTGEKGRLKPGAVPSIFVFRPPDTPTPRSERKRRRILAQSSSTFTVANHTDVGCEVEVGNTDDVGLSQMADEEQLSLSPSSTPSVGCQCELLKAKTSRMSVYDFKDNASAIQYYSRFDN